MECFGVPLHAWSQETFQKIGEQWGTMVCYDIHIMQNSSFSCRRILMDTCHYPFIQGSVHLSVEGNRYEVYVKELERESCHV